VQGAAAHVDLRLLSKIVDEIERRKLKSRVIGEVHDSVICSVEEDEESLIDTLIWWYGTQDLRNDWKWIIVPLELEKAVGGVDRPWSELEEVGYVGKDVQVDKKIVQELEKNSSIVF
jgi:DNA polymerase I-like protein with 3'-5' exonuclease and polymerase domains